MAESFLPFPSGLALKRETLANLQSHVLGRNGPRRRIQLWSMACVLTLWAISLPAAELAVGAYATSQTAAGDSFNPVFSPDGGHLAFESWANNLVANDSKRPFLDVFLRDLEAESTKLVSASVDRVGGGNGDSGDASVSSNGLWVAFVSAASDLVPMDTNGQWDVFVRGMNLERTHLVSRPASGQGGAWGDPPTQNGRLSRLPKLSADGRWVVFESWATNLTAHLDANRRPDIFARDLQSETTTLVSINDQGTATGDGGSDHASLSALKPRVAFESKARNIGPMRDGSVSEIYARDLESGRLWWASRDVVLLVPEPAVRAGEPVLCADGSKLSFKALVDDSGPLLVFDLEAERLEIIPGSAVQGDSVVDWSADGRWIAYEERGSASTSFCYLWNAQDGGPPIRISPFNNPGCGAASLPAPTRAPSLAWDGSGVAFIVNALNCVSSVETIWYQSIDASAGQGGSLGSAFGWTEFSTPDHDPSPPVLAANGNRIAVESRQSLIASNDLNRAQDIFIISVQPNRIDLASRADPLQPSTAGTGITTVTPDGMSADGGVIAMGSLDSVLSPWDTNFVQELYFSHWRLGTNQPITRFRRSGTFLWEEWLTPGGVSRDGRHAVFSATHWYGGTLGGPFDNVHWMDLATGLSKHVDACFRHDYYGSGHPRLHPDGSMVVFQSADYSTCVQAGSGYYQIYLWSSRAGFEQQYQMISRARNGTAPGVGNSFDASFSPDGRWISFQSSATNLAAQTVSGLQRQLFVRHWAGGSTHLASYDATFRGLSNSIAGPAFSSDSRFVAFYTELGLTSYRHTLPDTRGWKESYPDGTNHWPAVPSNPAPILTSNLEICSSCSHPSLNHDGSLAAYVQHGGAAGPDQIHVKELDTGMVTLASSGPGGVPANRHCSEPVISFDGRFVLFSSLADNLAAGDANRARDVFVRDRWLGMTVLLSRSVEGDQSANHDSLRPFFAPDGRTVVFQSFASDLDPGDFNITRDVFVVRLAGEDSDVDGLEDDWEAAYFGGLGRDGALDYDMDGHTDRQEFQAGTNPTNDASILSVLSVSQRWGRAWAAGPAGWMSRVSWKSVPGKTYALRYRRGLGADPWQEWPEHVTANATITSMEIESHIASLPPGGTDRAYYSVRLVD